MKLEDARDVLANLVGTSSRPGAVRCELSGPIARLTIDNPEAGNALTGTMLMELADAVLELRCWEGSALVLDAVGDTFCAGLHLGEVGEHLVGVDGRLLSEALSVLVDALVDLPVVSVCAVSGPAIGGGAELTTGCDHRVVSTEARFHFVQARLGVAAGLGGAARLVGLIGRRAALRVLSTAAPISAAEALRLGLADQVTDGDVRTAAERFLSTVVCHPVSAVRAAKRQVVLARPARRGPASEEAGVFGLLWGSADQREAMGLD